MKFGAALGSALGGAITGYAAGRIRKNAEDRADERAIKRAKALADAKSVKPAEPKSTANPEAEGDTTSAASPANPEAEGDTGTPDTTAADYGGDYTSPTTPTSFADEGDLMANGGLLPGVPHHGAMKTGKMKGGMMPGMMANGGEIGYAGKMRDAGKRMADGGEIGYTGTLRNGSKRMADGGQVDDKDKDKKAPPPPPPPPGGGSIFARRHRQIDDVVDEASKADGGSIDPLGPSGTRAGGVGGGLHKSEKTTISTVPPVGPGENGGGQAMYMANGGGVDAVVFSLPGDLQGSLGASAIKNNRSPDADAGFGPGYSAPKRDYAK